MRRSIPMKLFISNQNPFLHAVHKYRNPQTKGHTVTHSSHGEGIILSGCCCCFMGVHSHNNCPSSFNVQCGRARIMEKTNSNRGFYQRWRRRIGLFSEMKKLTSPAGPHIIVSWPAAAAVNNIFVSSSRAKDDTEKKSYLQFGLF